LNNLKTVFLRIRSVNLKINPEKCVFFGKHVKSLGHIVFSEGVTTDPAVKE